MNTEPATTHALTVVVCGAGPAVHVDRLIRLAQARSWNVDIIATPAALPFLDIANLEALVASPIRADYRSPDPARVRTPTQRTALIVAPATYNTICKLSLGISDTYALGVVAEAIGLPTRVVILPFVNTALASRTPFVRAVGVLRDEGVTVLLGPDQWQPHPPGTGGQYAETFPWEQAIIAAEVS